MATLREHLITLDQQQELSNEYERKNYAFINANREPGMPDSLEYQYPLQVLEDYITYVKEQANNLGLNNVGIKMKMGQYPEDHVIDVRQNPLYKGYQVVFLTPYSSDSSGRISEITEIEGLDLTGIAPPYN